MATIKQLLDDKGHDVWSVDSDATVFEAIEIMADKGIGALMVMDGGKPVGIVSERDYARKVVLRERSSKQTPVKEIMTREVIYASPSQSVEECLAVMTQKRIRHLPVMDGQKLTGIISIGDLVKQVIAEQKQVIQQLEHYISG